MKRTLVLAAVLTASLSGCAGGSAGLASDGSPLHSQPSATDPATEQPTPAATTAAPAPSGSGAPRQCPTPGDPKDLTQKPTYTVPKDPAPKTTTTKDIIVGSGPEAKPGDTVVAKYVGVNYATGEEFDSSWKVSCDNTFEFQIGGQVIPGFSKGATGMRAGGRRLVVIPPADGYGDQGPVPGGTLAFIIDVVKIN